MVRANAMESGVYPKNSSATIEEDCHANPAGKILDSVTSAVTLNRSNMGEDSTVDDDSGS